MSREGVLDMFFEHFSFNQTTQNLYYSPELRHFGGVIRAGVRGLEHTQQFIAYNHYST